MTKIGLWICVCTDDWVAESAIKASNVVKLGCSVPSLTVWDKTDALMSSYASWAEDFVLK